MLLNKKFTLLELMIVIAIIGILMTLLLPSLRKAREAAKTAVCMTNLNTLAQVAAMYGRDNNHKLWFKDNGLTGPPYAAWTNAGPTIQPYLNGHNKWYSNDVVWCPSDPYARTRSHKWHPSYGYNTNYLAGQFIMNVTDPSETIFLADSGHIEEDDYNTWLIKPNHVKQAIIANRHLTGSNILWVDGHVTFHRISSISAINGNVDLWDLD